MAEHLEAEGSRSIEDGALFHIEERLETFKDCSWPFDTGPCTVQKVGHPHCETAAVDPHCNRWLKVGFITVEPPRHLIGPAVLSVTWTWMDGKPLITLCM